MSVIEHRNETIGKLVKGKTDANGQTALQIRTLVLQKGKYPGPEVSLPPFASKFWTTATR